MTEVRTRDDAIVAVDQALQKWSTDLAGVLAQAQGVVRAASEQAETALRKRRSEMAVIEGLLGAASPEARGALQAKLVRAKDQMETARRANIQVKDIAAAIAQLTRIHTTATTTQVASARAQLSKMSSALEGYRSGGASSGGGGSGGGSSPSGGSSTASTGLSDVDVITADFEENPVLDDNGALGTFGKGGLSRADYRWAVQTWNDTVGPGVANGMKRDDFAARDERSNARALRRTADVYDMFLGSDRIRADRRPDGSVNITNGRHRLLVAKELGIKNLPGEVR